MSIIAIIGTLNNYGDEINRLKTSIEEKGCKTLIIDISMGSEPVVKGDITCGEIAAYGGVNIEVIRTSSDRHKITQIMANGARKKVIELYTNGGFDGIVTVGGATTALIASEAFHALPFGVPRLIVSSSAAFPNLAPLLFGNRDLMIMHAPVDPFGTNKFVENMLERAAGAICGMTEAFTRKKLAVDPVEVSRSCIALLTFGYIDTCANVVKKRLEKVGLQVVVFHAQGLGDRALDELIDEGVRFKAIVELAPGGLGDDLFGGARTTGKRRLEAAREHGIPQVCAPSGLNFIELGDFRLIKKKHLKRTLKIVDNFRTEGKLTPKELIRLARVVASKLNRGTGKVKFVFPLKGWSAIEKEGEAFYQPELDRLFINEFTRLVRKSEKIEVREIEAHINDELFVNEIIKAVIEVMES